MFHEEDRTDGQADMTNLRVAFRNFANARTECLYILNCVNFIKTNLVYVDQLTLISGSGGQTAFSMRGCKDSITEQSSQDMR